MFPLTISGRIESASISAEQVPVLVAGLSSALARARASDVTCAGNALAFRAGIFRLVFSWNVLVPVGSGAIQVLAGTAGSVRYRFSCVQMLVVISIMTLSLAMLIPRTEPLAWRIGAPIVLWLWLFGMNYMVASFRLPAFLRRALSDAKTAN